MEEGAVSIARGRNDLGTEDSRQSEARATNYSSGETRNPFAAGEPAVGRPWVGRCRGQGKKPSLKMEKCARIIFTSKLVKRSRAEDLIGLPVHC